MDLFRHSLNTMHFLSEWLYLPALSESKGLCASVAISLQYPEDPVNPVQSLAVLRARAESGVSGPGG
jgi:hypothetical protein